MEEASDTCEMLTEERLKRMSRNIKSIVPMSEDEEANYQYIKSFKSKIKLCLEVSTQPNLTATHRVAAWNTLCALVDHCAYLNSNTSSHVLWNDGVWYKLLDLYLSRSQHARPKSSKQLLATLSTSWLRTQSTLKNEDIIAKELVGILAGNNEDRRTKAALQSLAHFLAKDVVSLVRIFAMMPGADASSEEISDRGCRLQKLLSTLFKVAGNGDLGSATGQALAVILKRFGVVDVAAHRADVELAPKPLWALPLEIVIKTGSVDIATLRLHIFPVLFKHSFADYLAFLWSNGLHKFLSGHLDLSEMANDEAILFAALLSGKELGLVFETGGSEPSFFPTYISVPVRPIGRLLRSHSRDSRLTGLSLLINSHSATKPLPPQTFSLLKRHLHIFMGDTDSQFRGEVFSLMQKLMDRLRAITTATHRQSHLNADAATTTRQCYAFLEWLLQFLSFELRPTASYQHHISAAKVMLIVVRSGFDDTVPSMYLSKAATLGESKWPFHIAVLWSGMKRLLLDLLLNPFDDVRQTSASILSMYAGIGEETRRKQCCRVLSNTIDRAESSMLASGRADQADGVAHLYALLYRESDDVPVVSGPHRSPRQSVVAHIVESVEHMLNVAEYSLTEATQKYPVHGLLTSLRYVISQEECQYEFENIPQRLVKCVHKLWRVVRDVLCNDAPEGYQLEDAAEVSDVSTKDTLSYCWRALKECSLLMGILTTHKTTTTQQLLDLSSLCFIQLAELRHRGAFSTVAQTWTTCCIRCRELRTENGQSMIQVWYQQVLSILHEKTIINTRRSAGLPSLICGLLIADSSRFIAFAFDDLTEIGQLPVDVAATQESSLPQVHALNCIKDILKNTRLGEHSERYVPHCLRLAADSLWSNSWAVRNCGLMLFRAVIDRLLGTSEAHLEEDQPPSSIISVEQSPQLLDVILDLLRALQSSIPAKGNEGIFLALQLLQSMEVPQVRRSEIDDAIFFLTGNASWHIRDKAARVYTSFAEIETSLSRIVTILAEVTVRHNALHGGMLCAKYLAVRLSTARGSRGQDVGVVGTTDQGMVLSLQHVRLAAILSTARRHYDESSCAAVQSAWIDAVLECTRSPPVVDLVLKSGDDAAGLSSWAQLRPFNAADELRTILHTGKRSPGDAVVVRSLARAVGLQVLQDDDVISLDIEALTTLICSLGHADADACISLLEEVQRWISPDSVECAVALGVLVEACGNIISGDYDNGLQCEAQRCLLYLHGHGITGHYTLEFQTALRSAIDPWSKGIKQCYANQWLQLKAILLEEELRAEGVEIHTLTRKCNEWIISCCSAVRNENLSLYSREAAAFAIDRLRSIWRYLSDNESARLLDLCLAVYDLLNDDDEDIRMLAATITTRIVRTLPSTTTVDTVEPTQARHDLLAHMTTRWSRNPAFCGEAVARAFNVSLIDQPSVAEKFEKASAVDTTLFTEEKQNLYIDDAREAKMWTAVLLRLDPSSIRKGLLGRLARWVDGGLDELVKKDLADFDGALGWSTKAEIFTLGLQVIYGAEVLLHAAARGRRLAVRPSQIREKLARLTVAADECEINELWMRELRRVLDGAVLDCFGRRIEIVKSVSRLL